MNRRLFLKQSVISSLVIAGTGPVSTLGEAEKILTVLHTNDMHSRIDPFPSGSRFAGLGGMARRAALVEKIRKEGQSRSFTRCRRHISRNTLTSIFSVVS